MGLIAEYETDLPRLSGLLAAAPGTTIEHDDLFFTAADEVKWIFWATGPDSGEFERAVRGGASVEDLRRLTETPTRRLYRVTITRDSVAGDLACLNELDVQILAATYREAGAVVRVRCPSRDAYAELAETVTDSHGRFETRRLFREAADESAACVTPAQAAALRSALDAGYYEVPREATLEAVAGRLGVSDSAASARLRRGTANLLRDALPGERP